jgi:hypothetical protein
MMVGLFVLSWSLFFRLNLNDVMSSLRLAGATGYTATVEALDPGTDLPVLHWTEADGTDRSGIADPDDDYRLGESVRVLDYSSPACWTWETYDDRRDDLTGMVVFLFAIPGAAIVGYLVHRRRRWLGVLRITRSFRTVGRVMEVYEFGNRKGLKVDLQGQTVYVPLLRDQFVTALTSLDVLEPLAPEGGRIIPFRVSAAGRIVWPGGPYRMRLLPVGVIVSRVLWVCGPPLLTLAVHLFTAPIAPC